MRDVYHADENTGKMIKTGKEKNWQDKYTGHTYNSVPL